MMRLIALAAAGALFLAGCFVFDNPFDNGGGSTITFQIVVTSALYGGVRWNPAAMRMKRRSEVRVTTCTRIHSTSGALRPS